MTMTRYFKLTWTVQGVPRSLVCEDNDPTYIARTVRKVATKHGLEELAAADIEQIRWEEYQALLSQARLAA